MNLSDVGKIALVGGVVWLASKQIFGAEAFEANPFTKKRRKLKSRSRKAPSQPSGEKYDFEKGGNTAVQQMRQQQEDQKKKEERAKMNLYDSETTMATATGYQPPAYPEMVVESLTIRPEVNQYLNTEYGSAPSPSVSNFVAMIRGVPV